MFSTSREESRSLTFCVMPVGMPPHLRNRFQISPVLFGSYAKGTATAKSDVDLFVDSGLRGLKFTGFLYDIERAAGVRTDVLDAADVTPRSAVERELARTGVVIYER